MSTYYQGKCLCELLCAPSFHVLLYKPPFMLSIQRPQLMQHRMRHFSNTLSLKRRQTGCSGTDRGGFSGHGLVPSFAINTYFSLRGPTDLLLQRKPSVCCDAARAGTQPAEPQLSFTALPQSRATTRGFLRPAQSRGLRATS